MPVTYSSATRSPSPDENLQRGTWLELILRYHPIATASACSEGTSAGFNPKGSPHAYRCPTRQQ